MLRITRQALQAMRRHAAEGYPLEVCGLLAGGASGDARTARAAWAVPNAWEEDPTLRAAMVAAFESGGGADAARWEAASAERRYLIAPREVLAAMKRARAAGLDLVGVYHTHPNHPAVPSEFDRDAAAPEWSYVILSVRDGAVAEVRSWVLDGLEGPFVEEGIEEAAESSS
jgi:proteasome lid subunit RPN8/RPN11